MARPDLPRTILEFQARFGDEQACLDYMFDCRWPERYTCPRCKADAFDIILHRAISNFKAWLQGTHRAVGNEHLQVYLDEFTFRYNRRGTPMAVPAVARSCYADVAGWGLLP
jgi:hypothetical protein